MCIAFRHNLSKIDHDAIHEMPQPIDVLTRLFERGADHLREGRQLNLELRQVIGWVVDRTEMRDV